MNRFATSAAFAAVALWAAISPRAEALPTETWTYDYNQGTANGFVSEGDKADFNVYCGDGIDGAAGFIFTDHTAGAVQHKWVILTIKVDQEPIARLPFGANTFRTTSVRYSHLAVGEFYPVMEQIVERFRKGHVLEIDDPQHNIRHVFTLNGASKVLDGILQGCK